MTHEIRGNPEVPAISMNTYHSIKSFRGTTDNVIDRREIFNKKITTAFRDYLTTALSSTNNQVNLFKYHDFGTGAVAESTADTGLGAAVSEARATGTQNSTGGTYTSVATVTFSSSYAITEHGMFSQAAKPGGVLMDRTVFAAVNVVSGDSIQATFTLSIADGG